MRYSMRLVNRTLRDVRLLHLLGSSQLFQPPTLRHCRFELRLAPCRTVYSQRSPGRHFSTESATGKHVDLIASGRGTGVSATPWRAELDSVAPKQPALYFGKWTWLSEKPYRLSIEADFFRKGSAKQWNSPLLVDMNEHNGDFELWSCLLDHLQKVHGDPGVHELWKGLWGRKSLFRVDGPSRGVFWQIILEAALKLDQEEFLLSVWIYAEWMKETHSTELPELYTTVVSHFLRSHQHQKALRWHLRLCPSFYPGSQSFINMVEHFSTDQVLNAKFTLQSLYIASPERQLYDFLIPKLYASGNGKLARLWRQTCIKQDDGPRLHAPNKPFLRYILGYWEPATIKLHPNEVKVLGDSDSEVSEPLIEGQQVEVSREFMNRVHGETFGLSSKTYNDRLGARWFATSWVSLDTAITVVAALGIREIGPLSLQSIALREETPEAILARLAQLADLQIGIPQSSYVDIIKHFATNGDRELLSDILHCDLHPDVFDDLELQARLMQASAETGDWRTYRLLMSSRLAMMLRATRKAANTLLKMYMSRQNHAGALQVLDSMHAAGVGLDENLSAVILKGLQRHVPLHVQTNAPPGELDHFISIYRRLSAMDIPVPIKCWRRILLCLGRLGRLDELYELSFELVDYFTTRQSARPGFFPVHISDIPESMKRPLEGIENLMGLYIPSDTPPERPLHPLSLLFDPKLQGSIIRWSFRRLATGIQAVGLLGSRKDLLDNFPVSRSITVLRRLRESGVALDHAEPQLRKWLVLRLKELYDDTKPNKANHRAARDNNLLSLAQMKALCDEAWGTEFLPPLDQLKTMVIAVARRQEKASMKRARNRE